jgi:mono/diheme cytochrome c family protein
MGLGRLLLAAEEGGAGITTGQMLTIALIVLGPAAVLWGIFLMRQNKARKPAALLGIPQALRPAPPDEVLEGPRLTRILAGGFLVTVALVAFIPAYWLPEKTRHEAFAERYLEQSTHRGEKIFAVPPPLPENIGAVEFKSIEEDIALGQGCANCHGGEGVGGLANPALKDPVTGETKQYQAPPLNNIYQRWDEEVIRFTIERGRPGTPMPAWGVEFGGSMTPLMIDDVIHYIESIQVGAPQISDTCKKPTESLYEQCGQEIFEARCAVCHGPEAQGKEAEGTTDDPWHQGMALWKGDVSHLPENLHLLTVINGRRFAFMPQFGEAPVQGVPVPLYPLTQEQIEAVVAYERSL